MSRLKSFTAFIVLLNTLLTFFSDTVAISPALPRTASANCAAHPRPHMWRRYYNRSPHCCTANRYGLIIASFFYDCRTKNVESSGTVFIEFNPNKMHCLATSLLPHWSRADSKAPYVPITKKHFKHKNKQGKNYAYLPITITPEQICLSSCQKDYFDHDRKNLLFWWGNNTMLFCRWSSMPAARAGILSSILSIYL